MLKQHRLKSENVINTIEALTDMGETYGVSGWEELYNVDRLTELLDESVLITPEIAYGFFQDGLFAFPLSSEKIPPEMADDVRLFTPQYFIKVTLEQLHEEMTRLQTRIDQLNALKDLVSIKRTPKS